MADIDAPPLDASLPTAAIADFGSRYPLPFRILFLSALTVLGFATNLHLLAYLGIDTALVLDVRLEAAAHLLPTSSLSPSAASSSGRPPPAPSAAQPPPYVHPTKLYPPLYQLGLLALAWTALGWLAFRNLTGGEADAMNAWRGEPAFVAMVVGAALIWPGNVLAIKRITSPMLYRAVPFCDIILADILTSSAKVLGDVWVAGCLLVKGVEVSKGADACGRVWGVPIMTSLPYLFRFRQCLSEIFTGSTPTPRRSALNALKYATAFPVIALSAMQTVIGDPFDSQDEVREAGEGWISRGTLFNLWILAVLVNSLYSFWWDVTNDWGLSLLTPGGWSSSPSISYAFINPPANHAYSPLSTRVPPPPSRTTSSASAPIHGRARSTAQGGLLAPPGAGDDPLHSTTFPPPPSRPHTPGSPGSSPSKSPSRPLHGHSRAFSTAAAPNLSYPFLRPILLLPDPLIYYLAIFLDLLLRLTWSLKLSPHLHSAQEVEAGVFVVELMEVVRRWMWVYLRVEWEAVRKGAGSEAPVAGETRGVSWLEKDDGEARLRAQEEYELAARAPGSSRYRDAAGDEVAELGLANGFGGGKGKGREDLL
ncbi:protein-ER retention protein [Rhodosporidiobolus nylandii]